MKYVYEVYLQKSFSQAAKTLFVSQSAVSSMVRRAEDRIGCQIFDRSTIPFTLTEEGKFYISNVEKLRKVENDLYAYFDDRRQLKTGRLTLASSTFYCSYYLTRIANAFKKKCPGIHFDIMEGDGAYLKQWLLDGRIDFLFGAIPLEGRDMRHRFFAFEDLCWRSRLPSTSIESLRTTSSPMTAFAPAPFCRTNTPPFRSGS